MKILHAADGSPHAETAGQLLNPIPFPKESEIIVANVLEEIYVSAFGDHIGTHVREAMHDERLVSANELLKTSAGRFSDHFASVREELLAGHAAHELTELVDSEGVDLMTLVARGMNALERFLLGSTSEKVLRHAPCSVLVAHRPSGDSIDNESRFRSSADSCRVRRLACGRRSCRDSESSSAARFR